jgi:hypothetical protein
MDTAEKPKKTYKPYRSGTAWLTAQRLKDVERAAELVQHQRENILRLLAGKVLLESLWDASGDLILLSKGTVLTRKILCAIPHNVLKHIETDNQSTVIRYVAKSQALIDQTLSLKCKSCTRLNAVRRA